MAWNLKRKWLESAMNDHWSSDSLCLHRSVWISGTVQSLSRPPPDTWRGPYPGPAAEDTWNQLHVVIHFQNWAWHSLFRRFCDFEMFLLNPFDTIRRKFDVESLAVQGHHPHSHLHEEVRAPCKNGRWKMAWTQTQIQSLTLNCPGFQLMCKLFRSHAARATRWSTGAKWSWRCQHCGDAGWSQSTKLWYFLQFFSGGFLLFLLSKLSFWSERLTRDCFGAFDPFYTVLTSLEVPPSLNKMDVLNEYFGRFGPAPQFPSNSRDWTENMPKPQPYISHH